MQSNKPTIFLTERCPSFGATYYILFSLTFFASQTFSVQHKKTPNPCGELLKSDRYVSGIVAEKLREWKMNGRMDGLLSMNGQPRICGACSTTAVCLWHDSRSPRQGMSKISHFQNQINITYRYIIVKVILYIIWIHLWNLLAGSNFHAN